MKLTSETWLTVWQNLPVKATQTQFEILTKPTPQLSTINLGADSKEPAIMMMEAVILMVLEFYGIEWKSGQIRETAELVVQEYWWLQIAELKHFLTKVKFAHFGKLLSANQFTPPILLKWFDEYADESWKIRSQNGYIAAQSDTVNERTEPNNGRKDTEQETDFKQEKIKQMQKDLTNKMKTE